MSQVKPRPDGDTLYDRILPRINNDYLIGLASFRLLAMRQRHRHNSGSMILMSSGVRRYPDGLHIRAHLYVVRGVWHAPAIVFNRKIYGRNNRVCRRINGDDLTFPLNGNIDLFGELRFRPIPVCKSSGQNSNYKKEKCDALFHMSVCALNGL